VEAFRTELRSDPKLIPRGSRVLVALSGGPDSTALLRLLAGVSHSRAIHIEAAHFDHGTRPESADEADFASSIARSLGLPCHVGHPDLPPTTTQAGLRAARYRWLERLREERRADRIAMGHQADDQAETVLFHLMRGTGLRGLAGIPQRRGAIVRPLLAIRRAHLEAFLRDSGTTWIEDPSNSDPRWTRARIRTAVLPSLEARESDVVERLVSLAGSAGRAQEILERVADRLIESATTRRDEGQVALRRAGIREAGPELLAALVRRIARQAGVRLTAGGTRAAVAFIREGRSGGCVTIGGGLEIFREYGEIVIGPGRDRHPPGAVSVGSGPGSGRLTLPGRTVDLRWWPTPTRNTDSGRIAVAVYPGHYPLTFRSWQPGDRIRLPGGTRKLKKLFADRRIPLSERGRLPVLADRNGNVLWIDGLTAAEARRESDDRPSFLEFELDDD
jgi:tRNA(Ile)-lysidine synthase